ncbi:Putative ribonuclease H protein At1g65750 [Linum perenne]
MGKLKGIHLNHRCPTLSHVLFADDTLVFGKGTVYEAELIRTIFQRYCYISGQAINEAKSALFFSANTPVQVRDEIVAVLNVPHGTNLEKYLGMLAEWGSSKIETYRFLLERLQNRAQSWTSLMLSHGGRETLAKSVLQAIPSYVFSCFMLPDKLLHKMDSVISRLWWSGDAKRRTIHWCTANKLTTSKFSGGLGFRSFKEFNLAFLAKLAWKILLNLEALWVRLLKALYFPRSDFITATKHHRSSWIWSSIIKGRSALLQGLRKNIDNGQNTMLNEAWIPDAPLFTATPSVNLKVSDCILQPQNTWDKTKLMTLFTPETVRQILTIPIGPSNLNDKWIWHADIKCCFSIKSCYGLIRNEEPQQNTKEWKWLWHLSIPPKVRFFVWRLCNNALATLTNLAIRNCSSTTTCPCCNLAEESLHHLLFNCPNTLHLWHHTLPQLRLPQQHHSIKDWWLNLSFQDDNTAIVAMACAWTIWKSRNDKVFNNISNTIDSLKQKFHVSLQDSLSLRRSTDLSARPHGNQLQNYQPPNSGRRTLLCDGSFTKTTQKAGYNILL